MQSRLVEGNAGRVFECMSKLVLAISFLQQPVFAAVHSRNNTKNHPQLKINLHCRAITNRERKFLKCANL